jgi:CBS domain containing-hemolysin-like protein
MPDPASTAAQSVSGSESWFDRLKTVLGFKGSASIREDIAEALEDKATTTDFTPQERVMLRNILGIRKVRVEDVMIPRADIVAVPASITLSELMSVFRTQGHSRLPVYGDTMDDPRGMIHIRDFLDHVANRAETGRAVRRKAGKSGTINLGLVDMEVTLEQTKLLRQVIYVPPSMPAMDLLVRMQATRTHMALVVDEYGGTDGLVSIEDLVEMIVGDIEDEHDESALPSIERSEDGRSFVADAKVDLGALQPFLGLDLHEEPAAADVDTIGGLVVTLAQRVPSRGELIKGTLGLEYEVLDADPRRIKRVRIHLRNGMEQQQTPMVRAQATATDKTG